MENQISEAIDYLQDVIELSNAEVKLVVVSLSLITDALIALERDFCGKCTYELLEQMCTDLSVLSDALKCNFEEEKRLIAVFEDRIHLLKKEMNNQKIDIRFCKTVLEINN